MNRPAALFLFFVTAVLAGSNFSAPLVCVARDHHQQLRVVYGVSGNFIVRGAGEKVLSWSFAGSRGLAQSQTELLLLDANGRPVRRSATPPGGVLLGAGGPQSPALYFVLDTGELWQALAQVDRRVPLAPDAISGRVVAIGVSGLRKTELAVCRDDLWLLTVDLTTGSVTRETVVGGAIGTLACQPAAFGSLLLVNGRLLLATASELIVQITPVGEERVPLHAVGKTTPALHQVGNDWVQVDREGQVSLLVHLTADGVKLYQLPQAEVH